MENDNWGIILNGLDLAGASGDTTFKALDVKGWSTGPGTTGSVLQNAFSDGGWVTEAFDTAKTLFIPGTIKGPNRPAVARGFELLAQHIPRKELRPLVVDEDGLVRHMMVRLDQAPPSGEWRADRFAEFGVQLVAPDGRKFSGDGSSDFTYSMDTSLPTTTGGLQFPASLPWTIDAVQGTGSVTITNQGSARPRVKVLLTDVVNPVISANGQRMEFAITVGTGQTLEVDLDAHTVKLNGVNRRNVLTGRWIAPEDGTEIQFNASTYNANARMTVRWSDAWR